MDILTENLTQSLYCNVARCRLGLFVLLRLLLLAQVFTWLGDDGNSSASSSISPVPIAMIVVQATDIVLLFWPTSRGRKKNELEGDVTALQYN